MGGTCRTFGCSASRKATCKKMRTCYDYCVCAENECAMNGACVPKEEYLAAQSLSGLGNFSTRLGGLGGPMAGADSMPVKEFGSVWALICAVAVAGMATAAVCVMMASRRGR